MPWPTYSPALPAPRSRGSPAAPDHNKGECGQAGPDPAAPPSAPPADPPPSPGSPVADTGTPRTFRRPAEPGAGPPASPPGYCGHPRSRPAATRASSTERRESPPVPQPDPTETSPQPDPAQSPLTSRVCAPRGRTPPLLSRARPWLCLRAGGAAAAPRSSRRRRRRAGCPQPRAGPCRALRAAPPAASRSAADPARRSPAPAPPSPGCVCVCVCKGGTTHREKKK